MDQYNKLISNSKEQREIFTEYRELWSCKPNSEIYKHLNDTIIKLGIILFNLKSIHYLDSAWILCAKYETYQQNLPIERQVRKLPISKKKKQELTKKQAKQDFENAKEACRNRMRLKILLSEFYQLWRTIVVE